MGKVSGLPLYLFKSFLNLPEATISFIQVILKMIQNLMCQPL